MTYRNAYLTDHPVLFWTAYRPSSSITKKSVNVEGFLVIYVTISLTNTYGSRRTSRPISYQHIRRNGRTILHSLFCAGEHLCGERQGAPSNRSGKPALSA